MCGITGIYNFSNKKIEEKTLTLMNNQMISRGPDEGGIYISNNIGIAMRRLSIIDLSNGSQPMHANNKEVSVVFNGEIYNYVELRKLLITSGIKFNTTSDTEVILKMYLKFGYDCINYFNGMFAFAIFDKRKSLLWIARDRFGIKPLYYTYNNDFFVFGSSINAIKKHDIFDRKLSHQSLINYLSFAYTSTESIYKNINKLEPGSQIIIKNNKLQITKYWELKIKENNSIKNNEFLNKISYYLNDSIKIQSRSDVEIGSFLSGGIDSSAITSIYKKNLDNNFHTFSMTFDKKKMMDNYYAGLLSKDIGTIHHSYEINYIDGFSILHKLLKNFDEPIGDSAIIPSFFLSEKAKEHKIKVMLSGAGGDEIFSGYRRYFKTLRDILSGSINFIPNNININIAKLGLHNFSNTGFLLSNSTAAYCMSTSGMNLGVMSSLFNKDIIQSTIENFNNYKEFKNKSSLENFSFHRMKFDINNYLVNDILSLTDKASMSNSIEVRVPFLDHRLVELIFSNIDKFKNLKNLSHSKIFLKNILNDVLPKNILNRPKEGFNCPIPSWIMQDSTNKSFIKDRLMNLSCDFLKDNFQKNNFEKIYNNKKLLLYSAETLFLIYTLDYWFEHSNK